MRKRIRASLRLGALGCALLVIGGCVLAPAGLKDEQSQLKAAGAAYDKRQLPELPSDPSWRDVLHRAFLANGDLEAAYFDWSAAVARVSIAGAYPNTNISLGFDYMFSREKMKSWDRTTLSAGFDPMQNLKMPNKVAKGADVAFEQARAAGARFAAAKFDLQKKVLVAWLDYALMAEKVRIAQDNVGLLKLLSEAAADRVRAGAPQQDLLKAQIQYRLAENDLVGMQSQLESMRAMLNGMLARKPDAPLRSPATLPAGRAVSADDARLIAFAVDANPELAALSHEIAGRRDALELARMAYIPDITPQASITGNVSKVIGAMVSLPTAGPMIRGGIDEARAMLRSTEATARQARSDRAASFVAALYAMRNSERQASLFSTMVLPKAEQALASSRQSYSTGAVSFIELIDSQRTLLDVRQLIAEARIEREKRLAELEALAGVDIETLAGPTTTPATRPATTQAENHHD